jgi:hypothetical protein
MFDVQFGHDADWSEENPDSPSAFALNMVFTRRELEESLEVGRGDSETGLYSSNARSGSFIVLFACKLKRPYHAGAQPRQAAAQPAAREEPAPREPRRRWRSTRARAAGGQGRAIQHPVRG